MSSTSTETRAAKKSSTSRDTEDLANQIDAIRADIQSLTSTVTSHCQQASSCRAQDKALETANEAPGGDQAEPAIRRWPLPSAWASWVFGVFTRR